MFQAPKFLPPLSLMLNDLPHNHPRHVARFLGVSERTVWAWKAAEQAPRPATCWPCSGKPAKALQLEVDQLRAQITHLEAIGEFGAANSPSWGTR